MITKVLLADDDPLVCRILGMALEKAGFQPSIVHDGNEALRQLQGERGPRIALLDWVMPGLDGPDVCKQLRQSARGAGVYVFLISSRQSEEDMLTGFEAGVDEFIAKPFEPQVVVARLAAATRRLSSLETSDSGGLPGLLREACQGPGGEIILRGKEQQGRVLVYNKKIAWVQLSGSRSVFELLGGLNIAESDVRLVLEECRTKKLPFKDTLVSWGLTEADALKKIFRDEFNTRLLRLVQMPELSGFFVPGESAPFQSGFLYDLDEFDLLPAHNTTIPPRPAGERAEREHDPSELEKQMMGEILGLDGVLGVSLAELRNGLVLRTEGQPPEPGILLQQARLFHIEAGEALEETLAIGTSRYHLLHRINDRRLLGVVVDRASNPNIALVRMALSGWRQRFSTANSQG